MTALDASLIVGLAFFAMFGFLYRLRSTSRISDAARDMEVALQILKSYAQSSPGVAIGDVWNKYLPGDVAEKALKKYYEAQ